MMRKNTWLLFLTFLALVGMSSVKAAGTYFRAGEKIYDSEIVNHSYFVAGNEIITNSKVDGLYFAAGNKINDQASVEYGFLAGNDILVDGETDRDLFVVGNTVKINDTAQIGRDIYILANEIVINGDIKGNLFLAGKNVLINSRNIGGDVNAAVGSLEVTSDVNIAGTLKYNDDSQTNILSDHIANKDIYENEFNDNDKYTIMKAWIFTIANLVIFAVIINFLFPNIYRNVIKNDDIFKYAFTGVAMLFLVPIIGVILLVTQFGLISGLILLMAFALLTYISILWSIFYVGNMLFNKYMKLNMNSYLVIIFSTIIYCLIMKIPVVNIFVSISTIVLGLGIDYKWFSSLRQKDVK